MLVILLKAQYCYCTGQVIEHVFPILLDCCCFVSPYASILSPILVLVFTSKLSCLTKYQVDQGVLYLCEVIKQVNEQRQSKSWYLLRARTLQICSSYLSLDTAALPHAQRTSIKQHGLLRYTKQDIGFLSYMSHSKDVDLRPLYVSQV